jgi:hypothetical protein
LTHAAAKATEAIVPQRRIGVLMSLADGGDRDRHFAILYGCYDQQL